MEDAYITFFAAVARANYYNDPEGITYVDFPAKKHKFLSVTEMDAPMKAMYDEERAKDSTPYAYMAIVGSETADIHVAKSPIPAHRLQTKEFAPRKVVLVTYTEDLEISPKTIQSLKESVYPLEHVTWLVGGPRLQSAHVSDFGDLKAKVQVSSTSDGWRSVAGAAVDAGADIVVHVYNGDLYQPYFLPLALEGLESRQCVGCLSMLVYDTNDGSQRYSFEDHLSVHALKIGTLAYTAQFFRDRPYRDGEEHPVFAFVKDRENSVDTISPLEYVCCVASGVDMLMPFPSLLHVGEKVLGP
jgi:hypothetical protein